MQFHPIGAPISSTRVRARFLRAGTLSSLFLRVRTFILGVPTRFLMVGWLAGV